MWFIVFSICFVLLGLIVRASSTSPTKSTRKVTPNTDRQSRLSASNAKAILDIEFPRRKQILEESIQLIQETSNLNTLLSRYDVCLEHYYWIMEQKGKGLPIYFETEEGGFENALNKINNYHIIRIAMDTFINYNDKMLGLKTIKAKDNNTAKMFEFLEQCKESLQPHEKKIEYESKLDKLHNNTEDFYSENINT